LPYKKKDKKLFPKIKEKKTKIKADKIIKEKEPKSKKARIRKPKRKLLTIISIALTSFMIATSVMVCVVSSKQEQEVKAAAALDALPRVVVPEGHFKKTSYAYTFLKNMKAIKLSPKVDLYEDIAMPTADVEKQVDLILADIKTLGFNAIILDTKYDDKIIYESEFLESTPINLLKIVTDKAKAQGVSVVAVFNAIGIKKADGTLIQSHMPFENKQVLYDSASELARSYELDSILIDNYYTQNDANSYAEYINYGAIGEYKTWLIQNTYATVEGIAQSIKTVNNSLATGLAIDNVWQNKTANASGTETKAAFCSLDGGFADTKAMVDGKIIDFVNVSIKTSIENKDESFATIVKWWADVCKNSNTPLYITHSGESANSKQLVGWDGFGQLANQVSVAVKTDGYHGSAFTGIKQMMANMETSTGILLKYYKNEYSDADISKYLDISLPTKKQFVTYEESVQFRGNFDPNQEVIINGEKVTPSSKGGFSVWVPLKVGKNTVTLEHKGKATSYNIERKVIILKTVNPTKSMKVAGGSTIGFNVIAYKGSKITAKINGSNITLNEGGAGDENLLDSAYVNYQGSYKVPSAKAKELNIGKITFSGSYQGYYEARYSGNITIDKIPDEVDPDEATGKLYTHAVVNMTYANTYPYLTTSGYPQAVLYQLPQGTQDIVQSASGDFVHLRSGKTVHKNSVTLTDIPFEGNNAITAMSAGIEGNDTTLRATFNWKAPLSITPSPYPTSAPISSYRFTANKVVVLFDYTTYIEKSMIDSTISGLTSSSLFSSASFERVKNETLGIHQYKLTLTLSQTGKYYGCSAVYEGNTLVLRFNNPSPGTLSGLTIMVDPGHGGRDNGTMAGRDSYEKTVNFSLAQKVKAELEAMGATVLMTRYDDSNPSLDQRIQMAHNNRVDLFISVHHNSAGSNQTASGVETFFNSPFSESLARSVQDQLANYLPNRGAKSYNFFVAREKQFPSILIEYGFMSNPSEEQLIIDPTHQDNMARATAQGILNYYSN